VLLLLGHQWPVVVLQSLARSIDSAATTVVRRPLDRIRQDTPPMLFYRSKEKSESDSGHREEQVHYWDFLGGTYQVLLLPHLIYYTGLSRRLSGL
jgi:hypothetical protein